MPILVSNLKIELEDSNDTAIEKARKQLGIGHSKIRKASLYKKSLDARHQNHMYFVVSVLIWLDGDEKQICQRLNNPNIVYRDQSKREIVFGSQKLSSPIVIVGFGPAGIFCSYALAKAGYHPIVIERGKSIDDRVHDVSDFWSTGRLDSESNVQFGEGGAGTFSDGKLTTRISDSRCNEVMDLLIHFGAPKEIAQKAKPHIGTDLLRGVIQNLRKEIIRLGGQVLFSHKLEQIHLHNDQVCGITVNGETIKTENLVLAIGHSARDTVEMLWQTGVTILPKSFSVGVRIEHLQEEINRSLYGKMAGHPALPVGEYQLSYRENGRGVYTFCMCPGGMVVPSASETGGVVTNGMSEYRRDQKNANSALVVGVDPSDYGCHPMDGIHFQRILEQAAFQKGGSDYRAVGCTVRDFLKLPNAVRSKWVEPSYALGVTECDLTEIFPDFVTDMLKKGLKKFDRKLHGFADGNAFLTGVETRTSSPIRIPRAEDYHAVGICGLYPCGEGAGYAGGIMSAAVDGLAVAEQLMKTYCPE